MTDPRILIRDSLGGDAGTLDVWDRYIGRYDAPTHIWHKAPARDWRPVDPVPYTGGSDYSGDRTTAANREYWENEIDPNQILSATARGSHGSREIHVRRTVTRLAALDPRSRERILSWASDVLSTDTIATLERATAALVQIEQYPCLDEDREYQLGEEWSARAWECHGRHDCPRELLEFLEGELNVRVPEDFDPSELEMSLEDWASVSGERDGNGSWHDDGGENSVHLGHVESRGFERWLEGAGDHDYPSDARDTVRMLLALSICGLASDTADLADDLAIAVSSGSLSILEAHERAVQARGSHFQPHCLMCGGYLLPCTKSETGVHEYLSTLETQKGGPGAGGRLTRRRGKGASTHE